MTLRPVLEIRLGDRVTLHKQHPCGGRVWDVVRLGADIGLVCSGCGRRVLLGRAELERRLEGFVHRGPQVEPAGEDRRPAGVNDGPNNGPNDDPEAKA